MSAAIGSALPFASGLRQWVVTASAPARTLLQETHRAAGDLLECIGNVAGQWGFAPVNTAGASGTLPGTRSDV